MRNVHFISPSFFFFLNCCSWLARFVCVCVCVMFCARIRTNMMTLYNALTIESNWIQYLCDNKDKNSFNRKLKCNIHRTFGGITMRGYCTRNDERRLRDPNISFNENYMSFVWFFFYSLVHNPKRSIVMFYFVFLSWMRIVCKCWCDWMIEINSIHFLLFRKVEIIRYALEDEYIISWLYILVFTRELMFPEHYLAHVFFLASCNNSNEFIFMLSRQRFTERSIKREKKNLQEPTGMSEKGTTQHTSLYMFGHLVAHGQKKQMNWSDNCMVLLNTANTSIHYVTTNSHNILIILVCENVWDVNQWRSSFLWRKNNGLFVQVRFGYNYCRGEASIRTDDIFAHIFDCCIKITLMCA